MSKPVFGTTLRSKSNTSIIGTKRRNYGNLNIKNIPDTLYRKIKDRAKRERRSIAAEVIHILSQATEQTSTLSILDLQGLGKEVWKGKDAARYVNKERSYRD